MRKTNADILEELYKYAESKLLVRNREEFAKAVGYSRSRLSVKMAANDIDESIIKKAKAFVSRTGNVLPEQQQELSPVNEPDIPLQKSSVISATAESLSNKNEESLHSLIKSNAELVSTNRDLTDMLKQSINLSTHQHVSVVVEPLLHQLALSWVGKFWKDYDAGRIELNKALSSTSKVGGTLGK